jgi:hypothetical protein
MDINATLEAIRSSGLASAIRDSVVLFPAIESIHVIALTLVFGTIMIVDLRLLGFAWRQRSFQRLSSELLRWTWIAFAVALVTGTLMFISEAEVYFQNLAFRVKMLLLLLAGVNMAAFHLLVQRTAHEWDTAPSTPKAAKVAGALSLALWIGVIVAGRIIGFTTTGVVAAETEATQSDVNFDDFLSGAGGPPPPPPPAQ